jgi:multimeric flavodoxin WrbA
MPITVLGLAGSPRRHGNTAQLLERALAGAAEAGAQVSRLDLCRLHIAPCAGCGACSSTGVCVVRDDLQPALDVLAAADAYVLASPLYFMGVTAQAKAFIDRCQCLWARKYLLHQPLPPASDGQARRTVFISCGGSAKADFSGALPTVRAWCKTLDAVYLGNVLRKPVEAAGAIRENPEALAEAYRWGAALVRYQG